MESFAHLEEEGREFIDERATHAVEGEIMGSLAEKPTASAFSK